ncbi:hypothetical protein COB64_02755 [Candidatus Wolfebacteria bacterium]|nr:MAG: hypothetical protein COB64_02755 [Candidatus Wolfebacteria bacterium]
MLNKFPINKITKTVRELIRNEECFIEARFLYIDSESGLGYVDLNATAFPGWDPTARLKIMKVKRGFLAFVHDPLLDSMFWSLWKAEFDSLKNSPESYGEIIKFCMFHELEKSVEQLEREKAEALLHEKYEDIRKIQDAIDRQTKNE